MCRDSSLFRGIAPIPRGSTVYLPVQTGTLLSTRLGVSNPNDQSLAQCPASAGNRIQRNSNILRIEQTVSWARSSRYVERRANFQPDDQPDWRLCCCHLAGPLKSCRVCTKLATSPKSPQFILQ